jgi:hypothetical protein
MEKKIYLLAMIQFYFRDYDGAVEHVKLLLGEIKVKYYLLKYLLIEQINRTL